MSESCKPYYSRKSENDPDGADALKLERLEQKEDNKLSWRIRKPGEVITYNDLVKLRSETFEEALSHKHYVICCAGEIVESNDECQFITKEI